MLLVINSELEFEIKDNKILSISKELFSCKVNENCLTIVDVNKSSVQLVKKEANIISLERLIFSKILLISGQIISSDFSLF